MTLSSMTGFARHGGDCGALRWTWEIRSVNGKGLDVRFRLPPGYEQLDPDLRKLIKAAISRGNIQASLSVERENRASFISVNDSSLNTVLEAVKKIDAMAETAPSSAADILALRGVLEAAEPAAETDEATREGFLKGFETALDHLKNHRDAEGAALASVLSGHIEKILELAVQAQNDPSHHPEKIKNKLLDQVEKLVSSDVSLDVARLHQEAALLATKADIREEIDRLKAHCEAANDLIAQGSPVGRKLEFLSQEFNREANTLCSKSNAVSLTATGLELKAVIDQFREQVLNVE